MPASIHLLDHKKKAIRKETCWALSNITAGNSDQIERIITFPNLIEKILEIVTTDALKVWVFKSDHLLAKKDKKGSYMGSF